MRFTGNNFRPGEEFAPDRGGLTLIAGPSNRELSPCNLPERCKGAGVPESGEDKKTPWIRRAASNKETHMDTSWKECKNGDDLEVQEHRVSACLLILHPAPNAAGWGTGGTQLRRPHVQAGGHGVIRWMAGRLKARSAPARFHR
jgi:hypothetical protein